YHLSKKEGKTGTPEKPLSSLGLTSYLTYWKAKLVKYLLERSNQGQNHPLSISEFSNYSSITPEDIVKTISEMQQDSCKILQRSPDSENHFEIVLPSSIDSILKISNKHFANEMFFVSKDLPGIT
ncbi:MAG: 3-ketoacyl-CoA thiolase 5, peroxisomal, partial [Paramarteilia canceri]